MDDHTFDFPTKWFGYHKRDTHQYIRKIMALQKSEVEALQQRINQERLLNIQLFEQVEIIKEREANEAIPNLEEDRLNRLFADRLARSIEAINRQGKAEIEALEQLYEYCRTEYASFLARMDEQFAEQEQEIEKIMEKAIRNLSTIRASRDDDAFASLIATTRDQIRFVTDADVPDTLTARSLEKMMLNTTTPQSITDIQQLTEEVKQLLPEEVKPTVVEQPVAQTENFWDEMDEFIAPSEHGSDPASVDKDEK